MPASKPNPAAELADRMIQVLEAQRRLGGGSYPVTLRRLAELTDPSAPASLVLKVASQKKPFGQRVLVVKPKNPDSPCALAEDAELLAASPLLLEFVLGLVCSLQKPECEVPSLKVKLPQGLKEPFEAAVQRRIQEGTLPTTVDVVTSKPGTRTKLLLHLKRYPRRQKPEVELAENLVRVLSAQRGLGDASYPVLLGRLVELAAPHVSGPLVKKALAQPGFKNAVVLALNRPKDPLQSPVCLAEDVAHLAASPLLLEVLLRRVRTPDNQVCTLKEVPKKAAPSLQAALKEAVTRRIETRTLPSTVGCLLQKNGPLLFLMEDLNTGRQPTQEAPKPAAANTPALPAPPAAASPEFARAFDEAFRRLEQRARVANFVSLVDLRRELSYDRQTFDAELRRLRLAGRYTLSAAEGRHGIPAGEQEAGIPEDGALLLYVSRRLS
jgi:hypothetical protein